VVVVGVVTGTIAANLMSDRSLWTSLFKGFCNAGEAVLAAWLLVRWFDRPFRFGDLRRVLGFLAAAGLAAVASAIGGAASMTLPNADTTAPYWDVWRAWFLSDGVGIVAVAPLVIGLAEVWRKPPSRGELIEGLGVLGLMALVCLYTMSQKTGSWLSFSPNVLVLPLLLWLTARCPPNFGIAGAFLVSVSIIFATTFGIGRFGDAAVPSMERVTGAQVATMNVTFFALVLAVLFAQRKKAEDHKDLLISELDHRVKNTLAAVVAIAEQTRASSNSIDAYLALLRGRIRSLANTHALLSLNRWQGIAIGELVRGELAPCMRDGNTLIEGPDIHLTADAVQVLAIVLHELTTNAAKYGALSNGAGRVSVHWDWCSKESLSGGVILRWRETGGPTVSASAKPGYGTEVICDLIPYELGGSVDYAITRWKQTELAANWKYPTSGSPPTLGGSTHE
jgi:two-component sensor histidine kinase/integral membrane sensor domain MASE1